MFPSHGQIVLGSANFGVKGSEDDAHAMMDVFADLGGQFIDTAAVYSDWVPGETGRSERIIGDWLSARRASNRPAIATKGGHPPLDDPGQSRLDRASIVADVEASLKRLRVEAIDLYYLHRDDPAQPVEAILVTLRELRDKGQIVHVGLSNWTTARLKAARLSDIVPIASTQVRGNILSKLAAPPKDPTLVSLDEALLDEAQAAGVSVLLFSSQANGIMSRPGSAVPAGSAYATPAAMAAADEIRAIAADMGVDPTSLSLRFLLSYSPLISPAIGPNTVEQLARSMAAGSLRIPADIQERLRRISGFAAARPAIPAAP